jgi:hypothetical protein
MFDDPALVARTVLEVTSRVDAAGGDLTQRRKTA